MSSIVPISGVSSLLSILKPQSATDSSSTSSAAGSSSSAASASSSSGSGDNNSNETTTSTQSLPDGSTLIVVTQGDTVISETKIPAPSSGSNKKTAASSSPVVSQLDKFNDTSASNTALTGSLFNSVI